MGGGTDRHTHIESCKTILRSTDDTTTNELESRHLYMPDGTPRWFQLGMLSFLALISDWVCFSTASSPRTFEAVYDHNAEFLIDIFLYSNVFSCFFVTDTVSRFGMEKSIKGAAR